MCRSVSLRQSERVGLSSETLKEASLSSPLAVLSMLSSWLFLPPIYVRFGPSSRTLVSNKQQEISLANYCKGEFTQRIIYVYTVTRKG